MEDRKGSSRFEAYDEHAGIPNRGDRYIPSMHSRDPYVSIFAVWSKGFVVVDKPGHAVQLEQQIDPPVRYNPLYRMIRNIVFVVNKPLDQIIQGCGRNMFVDHHRLVTSPLLDSLAVVIIAHARRPNCVLLNTLIWFYRCSRR
jgi:hypothetical protein